MENMNISAVADTAMESTASAQPKHKWLSKLTRGAKKATMFATVGDVCSYRENQKVVQINEIHGILSLYFNYNVHSCCTTSFYSCIVKI